MSSVEKRRRVAIEGSAGEKPAEGNVPKPDNSIKRLSAFAKTVQEQTDFNAFSLTLGKSILATPLTTRKYLPAPISDDWQVITDGKTSWKLVKKEDPTMELGAENAERIRKILTALAFGSTKSYVTCADGLLIIPDYCIIPHKSGESYQTHTIRVIGTLAVSANVQDRVPKLINKILENREKLPMLFAQNLFQVTATLLSLRKVSDDFFAELDKAPQPARQLKHLKMSHAEVEFLRAVDRSTLQSMPEEEFWSVVLDLPVDDCLQAVLGSGRLRVPYIITLQPGESTSQKLESSNFYVNQTGGLPPCVKLMEYGRFVEDHPNVVDHRILMTNATLTSTNQLTALTEGYCVLVPEECKDLMHCRGGSSSKKNDKNKITSTRPITSSAAVRKFVALVHKFNSASPSAVTQVSAMETEVASGPKTTLENFNFDELSSMESADESD